ncbi:hypothetical protein [Anabaena sp. CCY 9402-a]|uniref:hypothetical protein n=1 Tax=Anabaena sp. CCY 9402-a TaxID=3103867 RepID=UPI0039C693F7
MELTLQELFGVNAIQDDQVLVITKPDLPLLTPQSNNTAESLLVAILINALEKFQGFIEDEQGQSITDENNNPIEFDNKDAYEFLSIFNWEASFSQRSEQNFIRNTIVIEEFTPDED